MHEQPGESTPMTAKATHLHLEISHREEAHVHVCQAICSCIWRLHVTVSTIFLGCTRVATVAGLGIWDPHSPESAHAYHLQVCSPTTRGQLENAVQKNMTCRVLQKTFYVVLPLPSNDLNDRPPPENAECVVLLHSLLQEAVISLKSGFLKM